MCGCCVTWVILDFDMSMIKLEGKSSWILCFYFRVVHVS